ncbi:hypothetical protein Gogos_021824, partial [Gossypium gossypioides]|nr:hypothetical protein [Gossypium gossypioides]
NDGSSSKQFEASFIRVGGKSPLLIFDDADVDEAAKFAFDGIFTSKGEICVAGSRIYVQEGIYDKIVNKLIEKANAWVVGDPFDPQVNQGPQVRGNRIGQKGYYIQPTIFADVKEDMIIAKEEIFGPVMSLMKFKTMEEAIKRANDTTYGLAAGVITKDLNVANTVSRSVRAGVVWMNCYLLHDVGCPYGGYKMSGFGRENGMDSFNEYLQTKSVVTPIHDSPWH